MTKTDKQWRKDNAVPERAKFRHLHNGHDTIAAINVMLKPHNLRVRTKQRRGHGNGSYVWVQTIT